MPAEGTEKKLMSIQGVRHSERTFASYPCDVNKYFITPTTKIVIFESKVRSKNKKNAILCDANNLA